MPTGIVEHIHIAADESGPMQRVEQVEALTGTGLAGDRYEKFPAPPSDEPLQHISLIEAEAIEAIARDANIVVDAGATRRNITTRGVPLNHLVDRTFQVGAATVRGVELCEPCGHMEKLTARPGICAALIHRGGLRAEIVDGGTVRVGDAISW